MNWPLLNPRHSVLIPLPPSPPGSRTPDTVPDWHVGHTRKHNTTPTTHVFAFYRAAPTCPTQSHKKQPPRAECKSSRPLRARNNRTRAAHTLAASRDKPPGSDPNERSATHSRRGPPARSPACPASASRARPTGPKPPTHGTGSFRPASAPRSRRARPNPPLRNSSTPQEQILPPTSLRVTRSTGDMGGAGDLL